MAERKLKWDSNYSHLIILRRKGIPNAQNGGITFDYYVVWLHGERDQELPTHFSNVKLMNGAMTVFDFTGSIFVGGENTLNLKIFEHENGVILAEIRIIPKE